MLNLNNLESLTKPRKRVGRGGSRGGTSGKGHKGQRARSGGRSELKGFFEGGQMSLTRRLPRRGFNNARFRKEFHTLTLTDLDRWFNDGDSVTVSALIEQGHVRKGELVKILGNGSLSKKLTVAVHACTKGARAAIEQAGGSVALAEENSSDQTAA